METFAVMYVFHPEIFYLDYVIIKLWNNGFYSEIIYLDDVIKKLWNNGFYSDIFWIDV